MLSSTGTTVKFAPVTGQDTMVKSGQTKDIQTKLLCITAMTNYQSKSLEELRVEDYQANRKFPTAGSTTSMGFGSNTGSIFGGGTSSNTTGGGLFGSQNKPSIFGSTNTGSAFGSTGTSAFGGGTASTGGSSLFGGGAAKPSIFGGGTTTGFGGQSTTPAFGATNTGSAFGSTGSSLFGASPAQKPSIFGGTNTSTSAFGSTGTSAFGGGATAQTGGSSLFGGGAAKPSIFGGTSTAPAFGSTAAAPAFGATTNQTATSSLFGGGTAAKPSLFGNTTTSTSSAFGATPAPAFGAATNTAGGSSLFGGGAAKPSLFGGGAPATGFGATSTAPAFGSTATQPSAPSLFGGATAPKPSIFGGTATGSAFGAPSTSLPGMQPAAVPQQQIVLSGDNSEAAIRQAIIESQLSMYPYGDSQLLRSFSLKCNEDEAKGVVKSTFEQERVSNSYVPSKMTPISSPKAPSIENAKRLQQSAAAQKSSAFNYKPLVQRIGFGADELNTSTDSRLTAVSSPGHNASFEIPKTNLFVPSLNSLAKKRDNPKRLESSLIAESMSESGRGHSRSTARSVSPPPQQTVVISPASPDGPPRALNFDAASPQNTSAGGRSLSELNGSRHSNAADVSLTSENGHQTTVVEGPCGVRLSKRSLYTEPPLAELENFVRDGKVHLPDGFAVGRLGYGRIEWQGPISFADVDLGEIVQFRRKEVQVYPDDNKKPPIGEEFNRKATISLDGVYPINRATREEIHDPLSEEAQTFARQLERKCIKMDADFVDYDAENGVWTFRVRHFSRYGFFDDDEEDIPQPKRSKTTVTTTLPLRETQQTVEQLTAQPLEIDVGPKNLFIADLADSFNTRMGIATDIMNFIEPNALRGQEPQAKEYAIRAPTRTLTNFSLTDEVFADAAFQKVLRVHRHPTVRRVGFGRSTNVSVITIRDEEATPEREPSCTSRVLIRSIKLVPTIEAYLLNHLKAKGREEDFPKLIRTAALRMKPPSDFLRLVDGYLFNDLRNNFPLEEIHEKMERFCVAMCQDLSDVRFATLQRRAFARWLQSEFEEELENKLTALRRGSAASSPYAPVFFCLYFGFAERAVEVAAKNGLVQLAMFIGLFMSGAKMPPRLTAYSKMMMSGRPSAPHSLLAFQFDGMKQIPSADRYRRHVYALLAHIFFSREHPAEELRKNANSPRAHLRELSAALATGISTILD
ncbi:Nuclear pore complex protein Nup98-Nup96 [Aphelenchoides fujianensis]|nr:Nuclear pore complex protein Nup98-Nup96 [Aphelenchoides fujianensis]